MYKELFYKSQVKDLEIKTKNHLFKFMTISHLNMFTYIKYFKIECLVL